MSPDMNCGVHVPTPEEIDAMGIERRREHPNFTQTDDPIPSLPKSFAGQLAGALRIDYGNILQKPDAAPDRWPPYGGATTNWADRTRRQVRRVKRKAPGVVCATYSGHGRTGQAWGVDVMVSPFNVKAGPARELYGDRICNFLVSNWSEMHINYIIWWNWMNDGDGWFDYEPLRLQWGGGSQTLVTSRHLDHVHFQVDSPYRAGNE